MIISRQPPARLVSLLILIFVLSLLSTTALAEENTLQWPRKIEGEKGEVVVYQPQIESFANNILQSRSAVSVQIKGQQDVVFGAMWFESYLDTDLETRMATLERMKVTAAKFPNAEQAQIDQLSRFLENEIPQWDIVISIDRLIASLPEPGGQGDSDNFNTKAPVIHFRTNPAVLVLVDGDPVFMDLEGYGLEYVANSAFFIVRDKKSQQIFLRGSGMWFTAADFSSAWAVTTDLTDEVSKVTGKVEEEEKAQAADSAEDAKALDIEKAENQAPPEIIFSTVPAELVYTAGEPDFASVAGTQLLYLKNSESDILMDIASQQYYILVSGRWFSSAALDEGQWQYVNFDKLPAEFAQIPVDSDVATVLTSVPGTQESREAVLETQIPQTAEVDRKTATVTVTYDGDPQFEKCGDDISYALNTEMSVLLIDQKYYCVDSAIWFVSNGPEGPWSVATEVPALVQDLPPDCPVYNVKYVYIYDSTPEVVYVGYTSGYYGSYVYGPCVIWGTGWHYRPWYGHYYYPRPVTYGYGVHYSPYSGWGYSFGVSYGWISIGVGWGRPPYGCWGAGGYRYGYRHGYWHGYRAGAGHGYRHGARAGYHAGYRAGQASKNQNIYRQRKDGVKRTGDINRQDRKRPSTSDRKNNVYTNRDGDVYRDKDGQWEKRDKGDWSTQDKKDNQETKQRDRAREDKSQGTRETPKDNSKDRKDNNKDRSREQQLDRDRQSRERGNQRDLQRGQQQQRQPQQRQQRGGGSGGRRR